MLNLKIVRPNSKIVVYQKNDHETSQAVIENLSATMTGSSHSQMFSKIGVLKHFAKFILKLQCRSLFNEVAELRPTTLLKKKL